MAKVYSWQITNTQYAYIVDPDNFDNAYVGNKLSGENLEKVKNWAALASDEDYKTQFEEMKMLCLESGYNLSFEGVQAYLNIESDCDNLRGRPGRGIKNIQLIENDTVERKKTYAIFYDDDSGYTTFDIYDGQPGERGEPGPKGAQGDTPVNYRLIMVYASGKNQDGDIIFPKKPEGGSYDFISGVITYPEGWHASDANLTPPIWMSNKTFTSSEFGDEDWTEPIQITGDNGQPGEDGSSTEFIYCLMNNSGNPPTPENNDVDDETPTGWEDNPQGVTEDDPYEWMCIRRKGKDGHWGEWSAPSLWSKYGVNGQDGDGVQYIYKRTQKGEQPDNPTPTDYLNNEAYMNPKGEYCPEDDGWTDDPEGVTDTWQYEWVASRKFKFDENGDKKEKRWQPFSSPSLWAKFGENGKSATVIRKLYAMNTSTSTPPTVPEGESIFTGDWGSGFPVDYVAGENVVWCIEAEIWADTNEFVKGYTLASTSKDEDGNIKAPSKATEENTIELNEIPNEKNEDFVYIKVNGSYYEWKEGWSKPYIITGIKGDSGNPIDYSTYVFGYGYEGLVPEVPTGTSPDDPGSSMDSDGNSIAWLDFPDTSGGNIDGKVENGKIRRWYQCCGSVDGWSMTVKKWGTPFPCNSKDGKAGKYTEFRFGVTDGTTPVHKNPTDRNTPQFTYGGKTGNWLTIDVPLPSVSGSNIMWQTMAVIDSETKAIESNDGKWSTPVRITGEKGEKGELGDAGIDGVPGVNLNQRYCLGTSVNYFGSEITDDNNDPVPTRWYKGKDAPYATVEEFNSHNEAASSVTEGSIYKFGENYFLKTESGHEDKTDEFVKAGDYNVYIWCTQGENSFELNENREWVESGFTWNPPFRLQGTNGLRGADGSRGQVIYPMGVYNANEVYVTTESRAPYVYDPGDGLYYVLKIVNKPWVGKFPKDHESIKITVPNGANNDNTYFHTGSTSPTSLNTGDTSNKKYVYWSYNSKNEYYELKTNNTYAKYEKDKYVYNGVPITTDQDGETPSQNYAKDTTNSSWERFETFEALFAKIGIISNGMIGSAVYNNEFMFSQQGTKKDGQTTTYDKTPFLNKLTYIEDGYTSGGRTYHWKDENDEYVSDENANPYYDENKYSDFIPNICMNFKTGQAWFSGGSIKFEGSTNNIATQASLTNAITSATTQFNNSISGLNNKITALSGSTTALTQSVSTISSNFTSFETSASTILNANFDASGNVIAASGLLVKPNSAGLISTNGSGQTATIGIMNGNTIVLESGELLISGIVRKKESVVSGSSNMENYFFNVSTGGTKILDITKTGGLIYYKGNDDININLPSMNPTNTSANTVDFGYVERSRTYIGTNLIIYNYSSGNTITLNGFFKNVNTIIPNITKTFTSLYIYNTDDIVKNKTFNDIVEYEGFYGGNIFSEELTVIRDKYNDNFQSIISGLTIFNNITISNFNKGFNYIVANTNKANYLEMLKTYEKNFKKINSIIGGLDDIYIKSTDTDRLFLSDLKIFNEYFKKIRSLTYKSYIDKESYRGVIEIKNGNFVVLDCKVDINDEGFENIFWEYNIGKLLKVNNDNILSKPSFNPPNTGTIIK